MASNSPLEPLVDPNRMIILSLKPRFADAILSKLKTVELRRTTPKIGVPTRALIYASTPVQALVGSCIVESVASDDLAVLWSTHGPTSGLRYQEFRNYFDGVAMGSALTLSGAERFNRQISLAELRSIPHSLRPPQSFSYVDAEIGKRLLSVAL